MCKGKYKSSPHKNKYIKVDTMVNVQNKYNNKYTRTDIIAVWQIANEEMGLK